MIASKQLKGPDSTKYTGDKAEFVESIRQALYASKIISYAQGFMLMRQAAKEFGWTLNYGGELCQREGRREGRASKEEGGVGRNWVLEVGEFFCQFSWK